MDPLECSDLDASIRELPPVDLDEERRRRAARHFAFRLHEVRNWIHECLPAERLPPAFELEESLRDGVLLAKLANRFVGGGGAKIVGAGAGVRFKHTDNINHWRSVCLSFELMPSILPDTHDVYVGRNVRTIFALVAFARRLFELRKAPPLRDQTGNVQLNEVDYSRLIARLEHSSCSFGFDSERRATKKASGADIHAALRKLRAAIDGDNKEEFGRLLLSGRHILHVDSALLSAYWTAIRKSGRVGILEHIQEAIVAVNRRHSLGHLRSALTEELEGHSAFAGWLAAMNVAGGRVLEVCLGVYVEEMRRFFDENDGRLEAEDVERIVLMVNAAVLVREATVGRNPARILDALRNSALQLSDVLREDAAPDYAAQLVRWYRRPTVPLLFGHRLRQVIVEVNEKSELKRAIEAEVAALGLNEGRTGAKDQTLNVAFWLRKCVLGEGPYGALNPIGLLRFLLHPNRQVVRSELAAAYRKALAAHYSQQGSPLLFGTALKNLVLAVNEAEEEKWAKMAALLRHAAVAAESRDGEQTAADLEQIFRIFNGQ